MNDLRSSKQDERMEEMLDVLESMEKELTQKDTILQKKDNEIQILQEQLNESLNLCEKLNSENKAENVQALKNELKQTRELLQSEKEKKKRADNTVEEYQDKLQQAEPEKQLSQSFSVSQNGRKDTKIEALTKQPLQKKSRRHLED